MKAGLIGTTKINRRVCLSSELVVNCLTGWLGAKPGTFDAEY